MKLILVGKAASGKDHLKQRLQKKGFNIGVSHTTRLPDQYRDQCLVMYLDVDRMTRIERLNYRNDMNDTIMRRMNTDDEQFKEFKDYEIRVTNADF